jgi:hypothetical protein
MSTPTIVQTPVGPLDMKYVSLLTLVLQNALQVIVMKYARKSLASDGRVFVSSTAVIMTEIGKLIGM